MATTDQAAKSAFLPGERWWILFLMVAVQAVAIGCSTYVFTFWVQPWMKEFDLSLAPVLGVVTYHVIAVGLWSVAAGRVLERFPARYLVTGGLITLSLGFFAIANAQNLLVITLCYVFVLPIGTTLAGPLAAMTLVARNFDERRGLALGIGTLGTSLGGVIMPQIVAQILIGNTWRDAFEIISMIVLCAAPIAAFILARENKHLSGPAETDTGPVRLVDDLRQRNFWILAISYLLGWMAFFALQNNLSPYAGDIGITKAQTATILSIFAFCMIIGKLATGAAADYVQSRYLFVIASAFVALAAIMLWLSATYVAVLTGFILLGLGTGAYLPLKGALIAEYFGPKAVGRIMGMTAPIVTLFAVGPMLMGMIRDATGSYRPAFLAVLVIALLTIPIILMMKKSDTPSEPLAAEA